MMSLCALLLLFIQLVQSVTFTVITGAGGCSQSVTVTAVLKDDNDNGISGVTVTLTSTSDGQTAEGLTDLDGEFAADFIWGEPANYPILAKYVNGSAIFAQWSSLGGGSYQGILPGNITITAQASSLTEFPLDVADFSNTQDYAYPGSANTGVIKYACDDEWVIAMEPAAENVLLYMAGWFTFPTYYFNQEFTMVSPMNTQNSLPSTSLFLTGAPYNVPTSVLTFNGLLRFENKIDSLNLETDSSNPEIKPMMTIALAPLEGSVTVYAQISCCQPAVPKFVYNDSLFVPNLWVWSPSFYFKAPDNTPLGGYTVIISANELNKAPFATCTVTTGADGKAQCQLATSLPASYSKISLNAQFVSSDTCLFNSITSSVQLTVFGFPDNGHHAFIVSNNTGNKNVGDKVVFSGLDWLSWNPFGDHDSRSVSAHGLSLTIAKTLNLAFGGYVNVDLTTPTCAGTFNWKISLLNSLPDKNSLPVNLGVLVADNLGANGIFNGAWSKILVLEKLQYYPNFGFLNSYGYLAGTYCTGTAPLSTTIPPVSATTPTPKPPVWTPKPTTKKPTTTTKKPTTKKPTTKKPTTKKPNGNGHGNGQH